MASAKLPPVIAVQVAIEVPQTVTATESFGRTALTFGSDVAGVRFMGDRDDLWRLIGQAGRALSEAEGGTQ